MIPYASNTGTLSTIAALRKAAWRVLITPSKPKPPDNLRFAIDNGAWSAYTQHLPFNTKGFLSLVERYGYAADFVVIPDIVEGGQKSFDFSLDWIPRLIHLKQLLLALQDGVTPQEVERVLADNPNVGLFLGGSTRFKLSTMREWGLVAANWNRWYHVGRVNSIVRIRCAAASGATSFDGTSVSRFAKTLPRLDNARKQRSILSPR